MSATEIGASDSVAVGKGIQQRVRRDSHNIIVKLEEAHRELAGLHAKILEMSVDIKLLQNMSQERGEQIAQLRNRVAAIDKAMFLMSMAFIAFVYFAWRG